MSFYNPATNPNFGQPSTFTPKMRLGKFSGPDPMIRSVGTMTVDIVLADGESYALDGFSAGVYRVMWTEDASAGGVAENYADFQAYVTEAGANAVKIQDIDTTDGGVRHTDGELVSVSDTIANDTVHFIVDGDGNLVLTNGTATSGTDRVFEIARLR